MHSNQLNGGTVLPGRARRDLLKGETSVAEAARTYQADGRRDQRLAGEGSTLRGERALQPRPYRAQHVTQVAKISHGEHYSVALVVIIPKTERGSRSGSEHDGVLGQEMEA